MYRFLNFLPLENNSIFINNFDGKGIYGSAKYIVEEIVGKNQIVKVYWLGIGEKDKNINIQFVSPKSITAMACQAKSKIWISTVRMPAYSVKRKNQYYIQTWHGVFAIKKVENQCPQALTYRYIWKAMHDSKMIDFYISANDDNTKLFENFFWKDKGEILEVGDPRDDIIINATLKDYLRIKKAYHYENKKVCLYAPTFRKDYSFDSYNIDFSLLKSTLENKFGGEWIIAIRLHPVLSSRSNQFVTYTENIIDASNINNGEELLIITDFLITDYSSICFDFIYLKKPIMIYASDIESYKKDRSFHVNIETLPFPIAKTNDELMKNIKTFDRKIFILNVEKFMKLYRFIKTGTATDTVCFLINKLLKNV
jgi:CDP-glycerol glycerophosphotransferase